MSRSSVAPPEPNKKDDVKERDMSQKKAHDKLDSPERKKAMNTPGGGEIGKNTERSAAIIEAVAKAKAKFSDQLLSMDTEVRRKNCRSSHFS